MPNYVKIALVKISSFVTVKRFFKHLLFIVLSIFLSHQISASSPFFSIEKRVDRVYNLANAGGDVFVSARQFVRNKYGQDLLNEITRIYGKENTGALAVVVRRFGDDGVKILKKGKSLDDIASALVKDKVLYRHIGSKAGYLDNLKKTGEIPSGYTTYFSADKFDDPLEAISKMQLNSEWTDAVWVAEFNGAQLVDKVQIPKAKWNEADYLEVLTKSFPKWGEGGASQFITKSSIKVSRLRNLKTGEVIDFASKYNPVKFRGIIYNKPSVSRINFANGVTDFTPLNKSGNPVQAGWNHVLEGHFNRDLANSRSVFTLPAEKVKTLLQQKSVIKTDLIEVQPGMYKRIADLNQTVGKTALKFGGNETSWVEIFTDVKGNIITVYPIPKP